MKIHVIEGKIWIDGRLAPDLPERATLIQPISVSFKPLPSKSQTAAGQRDGVGVAGGEGRDRV